LKVVVSVCPNFIDFLHQNQENLSFNFVGQVDVDVLGVKMELYGNMAYFNLKISEIQQTDKHNIWIIDPDSKHNISYVTRLYRNEKELLESQDDISSLKMAEELKVSY
jgi:hypothetical protein